MWLQQKGGVLKVQRGSTLHAIYLGLPNDTVLKNGS